jgi:hypothetical protein
MTAPPLKIDAFVAEFVIRTRSSWMKTQVRTLLSGAAGLAVGIGLVAGTANSGAADEKEVRAAILKMADMIEKNDAAGAKKQAAAMKDAELLDAMNLLALRSRKGLGVGADPDKIKPDGIEAKLIGMGRKPLPQAQLEKEAADLARMAYVIAAISEVARVKVPEKDEGQKKRKDWIMWSEEMRQSAEQLARAAKAKNAAETKTAAAKVNSSCNNCHGVFRD